MSALAFPQICYHPADLSFDYLGGVIYDDCEVCIEFWLVSNLLGGWILIWWPANDPASRRSEGDCVWIEEEHTLSSVWMLRPVVSYLYSKPFKTDELLERPV